MKNIELIDKAIDKFNGVWPKAEFDTVDTDKWQEAILLCLAPPPDANANSGEIHCGSTGCDSHYFEAICTEPEFLARKAERQNKPDWKDVLEKHPKAQYLAQWSGCDGENKGLWISYDTKPNCESGYVVEVERSIYHHSAGQIIGRWQDTLEQRPAVTESKAGQAGSAESDWHARGELPPTGTKCLCWFDDGRECWHQCFVIGSIDSEIKNRYLAVSLIGKHERKLVWANEFRPLRTEREKFIEAALSNFNGVSDKYPPASNEWLTKLFGQMFDAGFRRPDTKA